MEEADKKKPEYSRPWPLIWTVDDLLGPKHDAMMADREASMEFEVAWAEEGWRTEPSDVVRSVVFDNRGELSGTARLVEGPSNLVAEVFFGEDPPRVVATYQGRLPEGFYEGR